MDFLKINMIKTAIPTDFDWHQDLFPIDFPFLVGLQEKADIPKLFGENREWRLNRIKSTAEKRKKEYQKLKDIGSPYGERKNLAIELDLLREMYADTLKMKPLTDFFHELEYFDIEEIRENGFYDFYKNNFMRFVWTKS